MQQEDHARIHRAWLYSTNEDFTLLHEGIGCSFVLLLFFYKNHAVHVPLLGFVLFLCLIVTALQWTRGRDVTLANAYACLLTTLLLVAPFRPISIYTVALSFVTSVILGVYFWKGKAICGRSFVSMCALPTLTLVLTCTIKWPQTYGV